jgi:hypothetical protein
MQKKRQFVHGHNYRCLDHNPGTKELYAAACDPNSATQRWTLSTVRSDLIKKYWNNPKQELADLAAGALDRFRNKTSSTSR